MQAAFVIAFKRCEFVLFYFCGLTKLLEFHYFISSYLCRMWTNNAFFNDTSIYGTTGWTLEAWVYTLSWDNNGESALMMWGK